MNMRSDARDIARMVSIPHLLRQLGWRKRSRSRADCGLCRAVEVKGTIAPREHVWQCHRCHEGVLRAKRGLAALSGTSAWTYQDWLCASVCADTLRRDLASDYRQQQEEFLKRKHLDFVKAGRAVSVTEESIERFIQSDFIPARERR